MKSVNMMRYGYLRRWVRVRPVRGLEEPRWTAAVEELKPGKTLGGGTKGPPTSWDHLPACARVDQLQYWRSA